MHDKKIVGSILIFSLCAVMALPALADRGDDADRVSKNGRVAGKVGGVEVTIEFGRPNVKGRTMWGDLVPYKQVWRTGANEATTITFGQNAMSSLEPREMIARPLDCVEQIIELLTRANNRIRWHRRGA